MLHKEHFFCTTLFKSFRKSAFYFSLIISFLNPPGYLTAQADTQSTPVIVLGTRIQKEMVATPITVIEFKNIALKIITEKPIPKVKKIKKKIIYVKS